VALILKMEPLTAESTFRYAAAFFRRPYCYGQQQIGRGRLSGTWGGGVGALVY